MNRLYKKERDIEEFLSLYTDHVGAMTAEGLHAKSEIAAELAWRDHQLALAQAEVERLSKTYRCWMCGDTFAGEDAAAHFGPDQGSKPACQIDAKAFREMEAEVARYREEDGPRDREIRELLMKHSTQLLREEEKGYARGLKDGAPYLTDREREIDRLEAVVRDGMQQLETIVCTEGDDAGVFLVPTDSPTHPDKETGLPTYDFEHFSVMGDALIELYKDLRRGIATAPRALPKPAVEDNEEKLCGERDAAEEAMSQAYYLVTGRSPEWSNLFGYEHAHADIKDAIDTFKESIVSLRAVVEKLPKTADGVPITPDMTLFPPCGHKEFVTDGRSSIHCTEGDCRNEDWGENDYHDVTYRKHALTACYSTSEARAAAQPQA